MAQETTSLEVSRQDETNVSLRFVPASGEKLLLQHSPTLAQDSWQTEAQITGEGLPIEVTRPISIPGKLFWRIIPAPAEGGTIVYAIPEDGSSELVGAALNVSSGRGLFVTTQDKDVFGDQVVEGLEIVAVETPSGFAVFRFNAQGIPYELELPSGEKIQFDVNTPGLEPNIPGVASSSGSPVAFSGGAADDLRDSFSLIPNNISKEDMNNISELGIDNVAGPIVDWIHETRGNLNAMLEKIIAIGSRNNPGLALLNRVLELKNEFIDLVDGVETGLNVAQDVITDIRSIDFSSPTWFESLKSKTENIDLTNSAKILTEASTMPGLWSAVVSYPRDSSYSDEVWQAFSAQVDVILAGFDRNVVDVQVRNSGFIVSWNRIHTDDREATRAELQSLYGGPPWVLSGPWFYEP